MAWMDFYEGLGSRWFKFVHSYKLIYNTCWEDPRLDKQAMTIGPDDNIMVITSAGCNALDYALEGPNSIHAVDMNPKQNALLALKIAAIRMLDFETFFEMFGLGRLTNYKQVYKKILRPELPEFAQKYWDDSIKFFSGDGWRSSFYFNGTSGTFARMINTYIDRVAKSRDSFDEMLSAKTLQEQQDIYAQIKDKFWNGAIKWMMGRDETLTLLGVPKPQRTQVDSTYAGGIVKFIEDRVEEVFAYLPFWDNYFWRVYLTGQYTKDCCPEYLKRENFEKLKGGLVDKIDIHTKSTNDFLETHQGEISRFVLLDHMDWLSSLCLPMLEKEWQLISDRASSDARILWRSGGLKVDFVDPIKVTTGSGEKVRVGEMLNYHTDLAAALHKKDRVQTYGSFYIADLQK